MMWQLKYMHRCVLLLSLCFLPSLKAATCEETETSKLKWDLVKESIDTAKSLYPKCWDEGNATDCSIKDKYFAYLKVALDLLKEANVTCRSCPDPKDPTVKPRGAPIDCSDIQAQGGHNRSGVYQVWPRGRTTNDSMEVYCDMNTDGGGWTVFQRRGNFTNQTDFNQDWETYKHGFGDLREEFWLGNEKILALTRQGDYSVRFDLVSVDRDHAFAIYDSFSIGDEKIDYALSFVRPEGNATDSMMLHMQDGWTNGGRFATRDRNPACPHMNGFWMVENCHGSNLNGIYEPGEHDPGNVHWAPWKMLEGLYSVEIKIKRRNV